MAVEAHALLGQGVTQSIIHSQLLKGEAGHGHEGIIRPDGEPAQVQAHSQTVRHATSSGQMVNLHKCMHTHKQ
jgi:hypothetical protein